MSTFSRPSSGAAEPRFLLTPKHFDKPSALACLHLQSAPPSTRSFTRSSPSRHPPFTQYPFSSRSLVRGGQTSPHKPRLVVSHSTCPHQPPPPSNKQQTGCVGGGRRRIYSYSKIQ
jgi:hypothetical protein